MKTFKDPYLSAKTGFGLRRLMIPCLGIALVSMLCLLPGCGSDNAGKGAAEVKKEKSAKDTKAKDMRTITTLLTDKEKTAPPEPNVAVLPGNMSREEIEAKRKATEQAMQDPKRQVVPGVTLENLEAKKEAAKAIDPKREVLPGMTLEQFNAKLLEEQKRSSSANLFGLTQEQVRAKTAEAKQSQEGRNLSPDQAFPKK